MSFLDQTGLGTFWAKLKNYFVSKAEASTPVTGLTDILTPRNILNNSTLTRNYPSIKNPLTIDSITPGGSPDICPGWQLRVQNATLNNVTITRSENSIRIQGTATNASSNHVNVLLVSTINFITFGKTYTIGSSENTCTATSFTFGAYLDGQIIYNRTSTINSDPSPIVHIKLSSGAPICPAMCSIYDINSNNPTGTIDITFKNVFAYEGSYKNPPYFRSLDTEKWNQFQIQGTTLSRWTWKPTAADIRYRVFRILADWSQVYYAEFYIGKNWNSNTGGIYKICLSFGGGSSSMLDPYAAIKCNMVSKIAASSTEVYIKKVCITKDPSTSYIYFSIVSNKAINDDFSIIPRIIINNSNLSSFPFETFKVETNSTDTVLYETSTVIGLP